MCWSKTQIFSESSDERRRILREISLIVSKEVPQKTEKVIP